MIRVKCLSCLELVNVADGAPTLSPGILRIYCPECGQAAFGSVSGRPVEPPADPGLALPPAPRGSFPDASKLAPDPPERRGTIPGPGRTGGKDET